MNTEDGPRLLELVLKKVKHILKKVKHMNAEDGPRLLELVLKKVKLERNGIAYQGLCPFCNEAQASFQVIPSQVFWHCFSCGESGRIAKWIKAFPSIEDE